MTVITIPNRKYWAVFDVRNSAKPFVCAMFILRSDCTEWVEAQHYTDEEVIIKQVYALVNVV